MGVCASPRVCVLETCHVPLSSPYSLRVRLSGTKALCNALEFTSANFEKEVCAQGCW